MKLSTKPPKSFNNHICHRLLRGDQRCSALRSYVRALFDNGRSDNASVHIRSCFMMKRLYQSFQRGAAPVRRDSSGRFARWVSNLSSRQNRSTQPYRAISLSTRWGPLVEAGPHGALFNARRKRLAWGNVSNHQTDGFCHVARNMTNIQHERSNWPPWLQGPARASG